MSKGDVLRHAQQEGWQEARTAFRAARDSRAMKAVEIVQAKAVAKAAISRFQTEQEINEAQHVAARGGKTIINNLLARMNEAMKPKPPDPAAKEGDTAPVTTVRPGDVKTLLEALDLAARQERLSAGIPLMPIRVEHSGSVALTGLSDEQLAALDRLLDPLLASRAGAIDPLSDANFSGSEGGAPPTSH